MEKNVQIIVVAVIAVVIIGSVSAVILLTPPPTEEELRYAFLLPGSITDSGWNAQMYLSIQQVEAILGVTTKTAYGLGQAGVSGIMLEYAEAGYDVIWGHTIQYADAANQIAPSFPDTWFVGTTYYQRDYPNIIGFQNQLYQGCYLIGMFAGGITNSGRVGFVGAFSFGNQIAIANSFYLGANATYFARTGNAVNISVIWTGVWDDVDKGREAGEALLSTGVDAAAARGNGMTLGVIQAFSAVNDTYMFGDVADQTALSPHTIVASNVLNSTVTILEFESMRAAGTLDNNTLYGLGMTHEETVIIRNPYFTDNFLNSRQANLTTWIIAETASIVANETQVPYIQSPLY